MWFCVHAVAAPCDNECAIQEEETRPGDRIKIKFNSTTCDMFTIQALCHWRFMKKSNQAKLYIRTESPTDGRLWAAHAIVMSLFGIDHSEKQSIKLNRRNDELTIIYSVIVEFDARRRGEARRSEVSWDGTTQANDASMGCEIVFDRLWINKQQNKPIDFSAKFSFSIANVPSQKMFVLIFDWFTRV